MPFAVEYAGRSEKYVKTAGFLGLATGGITATRLGASGDRRPSGVRSLSDPERQRKISSYDHLERGGGADPTNDTLRIELFEGELTARRVEVELA